MAAGFEEKRIKEEYEEFLRAARSRDTTKVAAFLKADPSLLTCEEAGGFCALHFAASNGDKAMLDLLLSHKDNGLKIDQVNYDGNTPLIVAAKCKQHEAIEQLADAGADINFKGKMGITALHHAAAMGNPETIKFIMQHGGKLEQEPSECGSVLHWACHSEDCYRNTKVIGLLLYTYGFPIDIKDAHGGTPLFVAIHMKRPETVLFLLEHGANPNAVVEGDGSTALMTAVEHGSASEVKNLIAFGADLSPKNKEGHTALDLAADKPQSKKELTKPQPDSKKREEDAARFKAQGNKVFAEGESRKAAKFYSLAISLTPNNHVFFSNRSACHFNVRSLWAAYFDACRCVALNKDFVRGYFRKASTLNALKEDSEARLVIEEGLKLDKGNSDLITLRDEMNGKHKK